MKNLLKIAIATLTASAAALATYQLLSTPPQPDPPLTLEERGVGWYAGYVGDSAYLEGPRMNVTVGDPDFREMTVTTVSEIEYQSSLGYRQRMHRYAGTEPQMEGWDWLSMAAAYSAGESTLVRLHATVCSMRSPIGSHNEAMIPALASTDEIKLMVGLAKKIHTPRDMVELSEYALARAAMSKTWCFVADVPVYVPYPDAAL